MRDKTVFSVIHRHGATSAPDQSLWQAASHWIDEVLQHYSVHEGPLSCHLQYLRLPDSTWYLTPSMLPGGGAAPPRLACAAHEAAATLHTSTRIRGPEDIIHQKCNVADHLSLVHLVDGPWLLLARLLDLL